MKFKSIYPSAVSKRGILFVEITDVLSEGAYLSDENVDRLIGGLNVLKQTKFRAYAISFRGLSYLSSQAIGHLIAFQEWTESEGRRLLIYELHPKVKALIGELGLDRYFDIYGLKGHVLRFFSPAPDERCEGEG